MPLKKQTEKTNNEQSKPYNQMQLFYKMHFFPINTQQFVYIV